MPLRKKWNIKKLSDKALRFGDKLSLHPFIVQLLLNRNVKEEDIGLFLNPCLDNLHSPFLLPDIEKAIGRIHHAIKKNENIVLFGDYDVDGITSLTIFYDYLKEKTRNFSFYIPHRVKEGFGLKIDAIKRIKRKKTHLLICFDCGTNAEEEIKYAKNLGIEVIVVDHHEPKEGKNFPFAFINPKRNDSKYPFKELSSGALSFKLVQALSKSQREEALDLVALSTVCDVVPLRGENRILLLEGLRKLRTGKRAAIRALCETARIPQEAIDIYHLGFILGPRINASGRISTAHESLELFLSNDETTALLHAEHLEKQNNKRRGIESAVLKEADQIVARQVDDSHVLVAYKKGWHSGILGIVASRLADKYYRPAFVIGFEKDLGKGSARSIEQFNLMHILDTCEEYLHAYGGHKKAAGIEIFYKDVDAFRDKINEAAKDTLDKKSLIPTITVDLAILFDDITPELVEAIERLKPFGEGNPVPLFLTRGVTLRQPPRKVGTSLHNVWLSNGNRTYEATFYQRSGFLDFFKHRDVFDVVYTLEKNTYHNTVKLILKDVRLGNRKDNIVRTHY